MDMLFEESCVEIAFSATGQIITEPGPFTHTSRPEELLFQLNKFFLCCFQKESCQHIHCCSIVKAKALCCQCVYYGLYWVVNQPNVLPQDMLDNNWWNNVKKIAWKDCSTALQTEKQIPTGSVPSIHLFLSVLHFLSFLSFLFLSLSLSLCIFMYGHRNFHITCVPTAVGVSACVCLCL